jgi:hypothetical protein
MSKQMSFLAAVVSILSLGACSAAPQVASNDLGWPVVTRQSKPWTRWWWLGSIVDKEDLTAEMEKYQKAGLGGLEITPIYGVKGYESRFINYLTPQWIEMLEHTLQEADRLDMGIDMATGNGWPFGGPWVGPEDAAKNAVYKTFTVKAGESLTEPIGFVQKPLVRAIGRRVDVSELKEPGIANENLQALAIEQLRFEQPLPLLALMAYSDQGQVLNLRNKIREEGRLDWTAPEGNWTLYAVFQGWHGKWVERAGPGGEGDVIDHFSHEALGNYLRQFDRAFKNHDISSLRAFFNDSYEVDDAVGESNWTPRFFDEFKKRRGYDLRDHLPALFGADSADKNARVLCDYRETISDLLLDEFTIFWGQWAQGKGAITRDQAHGSPANILDLYAASSIPETEGQDILKFKFASSAAHVTGKPLASSESATWLNEHFLATLGDVKQALDRFFLGGINHIFYHGTPFSPAGEEWPGWLFYAAVHFGPTNSFWTDFPTLNAYVARCQSFLQSGRAESDVLVYFPIYDVWSQRGRSMLQHFDGSPAGTSLRDLSPTLLQAGYAFDLVSDRQLQGVNFAGGMLETGGMAYKAVVLPKCQYIPLATFTKLADLARAGATIVVIDQLPSDVPGWANLEQNRSGFQRLVTQLQFKEASQGVQAAPLGQGRFVLGGDVRQLLSCAGIERESLVDQGLQFVRRSLPGGKCYFLVNGSTPLDGWVPLQTDTKSVGIYDPMTGRLGLASIRPAGANMVQVYLQLAAGQSCIVRTFDTIVQGPAYGYWKPAGESQAIRGTWTVHFTQGGPELPADVQTQELGSWTQYDGEAFKNLSGTGEYSITFDRPPGSVDGWLLDLGRVCESANVRLNGKDLGTLIGSPFQILIPGDQIQSKNTLRVRASNLMANRIADMDRRGVVWKKFYNVNFPSRLRENRGPDGLFDASKWPPRDSGLMGPVMLTAMQRLSPQ